MLQTRKSFLGQRRSTSCWTPMTSAGIIAPLRPSNKHGFPSWHGTFIKSQSIQKLEDSESTLRKRLWKPNIIFAFFHLRQEISIRSWLINKWYWTSPCPVSRGRNHPSPSQGCDYGVTTLWTCFPPWRSTRVSWDRRRSPISWRKPGSLRSSILRNLTEHGLSWLLSLVSQVVFNHEFVLQTWTHKWSQIQVHHRN